MAGLPEHLAKGPVGREPLAREVVERHQRQRIAAAAATVFAKRGYRATTIDHIVAAARVGVGSFYSLFEGKEECFLFVYDTVVGEGRQRLREVAAEETDWAEAAISVLRALLELIAEEPLRARIVFVEAPTAGAAAEERYAATMEEPARLLRAGRELREGGADLPAGLEPAAAAGLAWLIHQRLVGGRPEDIPALLPEAAEIVLGPYLGPAETAAAVSRISSAATV